VKYKTRFDTTGPLQYNAITRVVTDRHRHTGKHWHTTESNAGLPTWNLEVCQKPYRNIAVYKLVVVAVSNEFKASWLGYSYYQYSETLGAVLTAQTTYFTYLYYLCSIIICF